MPYVIELSFQLALIGLYLSIFYQIDLKVKKADQDKLLFFMVSATFLAEIISLTLEDSFNLDTFMESSKELGLLMLSQYALSPIYSKLVKEHATDSVRVIVFILVFVYLISYDYSGIYPGSKAKGKEDKFKDFLGRRKLTESTLSLFLVYLTLVLLCSRLSSSTKSFSLQVAAYG